MAEIGEWFYSMPPITRHWFAASLAIPLLCRFNIFSPYSMILTSDFLTQLQLWKPLTSVLYYPLTGNKGFHFLMNLYFIYNYSQRLEMGLFASRPADYVFMLFFSWITLVVSPNSSSGIDPIKSDLANLFTLTTQGSIVSAWPCDADGCHGHGRNLRLLYGQPRPNSELLVWN